MPALVDSLLDAALLLLEVVGLGVEQHAQVRDAVHSVHEAHDLVEVLLGRVVLLVAEDSCALPNHGAVLLEVLLKLVPASLELGDVLKGSLLNARLQSFCALLGSVRPRAALSAGRKACLCLGAGVLGFDSRAAAGCGLLFVDGVELLLELVATSSIPINTFFPRFRSKIAIELAQRRT